MFEKLILSKTSHLQPTPQLSRDSLGDLKELSTLLLDPVKDLLSGPSKKVRSGLLLTSVGLCSQNPLDSKTIKQSHVLAEVLENLHAGSLIIDDIQDESPSRRGQASLHKKLDVPLAINAGNWLYFKALQLISKAQLAPALELRVHQLCHETLFEGHLGQALDIGIRIDQIEQSRVPLICYSAMAMKSGALTGLATEIGAHLAGAPDTVIEGLRDFGQSFGCVLQMFNDLREFSHPSSGLNQDLYLRRPSWIWNVAAQSLSASDYAELKKLLNSIFDTENSATGITEWLRERHIVEDARHRAEEKMRDCLVKLSMILEKNGLNPSERSDWLELLRISSKVQGSNE
jgi:geranylgeranyl pyrophosphate synthase